MNSFDIAVCILFYNKSDQTIECLESVIGANVNIYILNNGSDKEHRIKLGRFVKKHNHITLIDVDRNLGVSGGRNKLITDTRERWLLFLDNDTTVKTKDWIDKVAAKSRSCTNTDVFIPTIFNSHENALMRRVVLDIDTISGAVSFRSTTENSTNFFPGGASFVNRHLFERLGLYDEAMFVGFEDFELAIRAIKSGYPIVATFVPDIEIEHTHRYSSNRADKESARVRYDSRIIFSSHERVREKYGVVLDPDFGAWLDEQIRQLTWTRRRRKWHLFLSRLRSRISR
jgi:GT2 family glycosyltransferase